MLTTDRSEYVASYLSGEGNLRRYGFTVIARFENRLAQDVYLDRCFPISVLPIYGIALVSGGTGSGSAYSHPWACVGHDQQFLLRPGQVRVDTIAFSGPNLADATGRPIGTLTGRMQLSYWIQACAGNGAACPLPLELARSNVFAVRLEQ